MNPKLIQRAAIKYQNWMISQQFPLTPALEEGVARNVKTIRRMSRQIWAWNKRFCAGVNPKIQVSPWELDHHDNKVEHIGITNSDVYESIATHMIPNLCNDTIKYAGDIISLLKRAVSNETVAVPPLREVVAEIKIICDECGKDNVKFRDSRLSVRIKNIRLDDENETVELGDFWIHLNLTNPLSGLRIESINKIQSESGHVHPHVQSNNLCAGNGCDLMVDAICQGRLEDYFRLVEAILRTYNDESPYKELSDWYNPEHDGEFYCECCEKWRPDDIGLWCNGCETQYCYHCDIGSICIECDEWGCNECSVSCHGCDEGICKSCVVDCNDCNQYFCTSCLNPCLSCERVHCESCLQSCTNCNDAICNECSTTCKGCGDTMCESCNKEHNCLLAEVEDGK